MNDWLAKFPSVNARIVVGLLESIGFAIYLAVGIWLHRFTDAQFEQLVMLAAFIATHEGLSLTGFGIKRKTYKPEAHAAPPREDVQPPKPEPQP